MEAEHWNDLAGLLEQALKHPPERRPSFLKKACGADTSLHQTSEDLLAIYNKAEKLFESCSGFASPEDAFPDKQTLLDWTLSFYRTFGRVDTRIMRTVFKAYQEKLFVPMHHIRKNGYGNATNIESAQNGAYSYKADKRIRPLFDALVELTPDAREVYLAGHCGDETPLRRKVESLLAAYDAHDPVVRHILTPLPMYLSDRDDARRVNGTAHKHTLTGRNVLHYQILEKLGAGGMSIVYKARDIRLDRLVALKFLPPHVGNDDETRTRFFHEARAASALDHINICTIHDIGEIPDSSGSRLFIAMSYYQGETLKEKIERGPLPFDKVIDYSMQIADGLSRTHEAGIIHRDVKSANILVTDDGVIKILDFGLAKLQGRTKMTKTGTTLGTVAYMSPEQARGEFVDYRTDLWSLGVVMYEMLSGRRPFRGEYDQAVIYSILNEDHDPVADLQPDLPVWITQAVNKLLSKDPAGRYKCMGGLSAELRRFRESASTNAGAAPSTDDTHGFSLAVLPFANMSADPGQEYFCDGISEELINALTRVKDLRVAARTSTFVYKNQNVDVHRIGRQLKVRAILEGSVRKEGDRLRITVRLIDAADGLHLWSEQYDRVMENAFTVQDEITTTILKHLMVRPLSLKMPAHPYT